MDIVLKLDPRSGKLRPVDQSLTRKKVVRVVPTSDALRKMLKHYPSKVGFPAEGSAEWPYDNFTRRRIKDGDVTIEEPTTEDTPPAAE